MKKYKVGLFGACRGQALAREFVKLNSEVVALCDMNVPRRNKFAEELGNNPAQYDKFEDFIEHDLDVVIVANYFPEHAPYAIECFKRGIHVLSECTSNGTMAEGVELIRAYEKSDSFYMLAENVPSMLFNREMKRVIDSGALGKIVYAEGEYNHTGNPMSLEMKRELNNHPKHWRNFLPRTYYLTHSLGPVMWLTGATPKRVTAMAAFCPPEDAIPFASHNGDKLAMMLTQNDDGSVFRFTGNSSFACSQITSRVCGTKGQMETPRGMNGQVMLQYDSWSKPEGAAEKALYTPSWNDKDEELILQSGHSGADFLTVRMFLEALEAGKEPEFPMDIHGAVTMASVAILGHRSVLEGGMPYDIPDFHLEEDRKKYENDRATPFYGPDGSEPTVPCCSHPDYRPTEEQVRLFHELVMQEKPEEK